MADISVYTDLAAHCLCNRIHAHDDAPPPAMSTAATPRPPRSAKDVARLAGVSTATVSRFLNSPDQVDAETRGWCATP